MSDKTRSLRRNLRKIKHKRVKNFIAQIINIFNYFKTKKNSLQKHKYREEYEIGF